VERELAGERELSAEQDRLQKLAVAKANRAAAINEVGLEVWAGAFREAADTGTSFRSRRS
jgi:hypothetical protein